MFATAIMLIDLSKHVYKIVIFTHEKTSQKMEFDGLYSRVREDSLEVNSQEFPQRWFSDHTRITRVSIIEHIEVILPKRSVNLPLSIKKNCKYFVENVIPKLFEEKLQL